MTATDAGTQDAADPADADNNVRAAAKEVDDAENSSPQTHAAMPKMAALLADAAGPLPEPVPAVHYRSQGRTLIIGRGDTALQWATQLQGQLEVTALLTERPAQMSTGSDFRVLAGSDIQLDDQAEAFCCIVCNKPIGTVKVIENLFLKLGSHSAFAGNPDRLRMCADYRVIGMMGTGSGQTTIAPPAHVGTRELQRPRS